MDAGQVAQIVDACVRAINNIPLPKTKSKKSEKKAKDKKPAAKVDKPKKAAKGKKNTKGGKK